MKRRIDETLALILGLVFGVSYILVSTGVAGEKRNALFVDANAVAAAFAKGAPIYETQEYKIHASRRERPGEAEVHTRDTDIVYVLEGQATLVTGGTVIEPHSTAPDEIRGRRIEGGESHELVPGEVVVIPNGTPHWFEEVNAPFLYYVVKVSDATSESAQR